jgi:hypothetical protein
MRERACGEKGDARHDTRMIGRLEKTVLDRLSAAATIIIERYGVRG